ncbi:MAG: quinone oxidoreductase [Acidobacteria bacterium]|nr:quinone oxidoreductase [Acidobacteriota bacterium]MBI3655088.1 quinone oxidoreductase [Acidobacteriota bacterium]
MKAVRIHEYGGPEMLRYEEVACPTTGPGEARVRINAAGVNYIDIYHRTGLYKSRLPLTLGMEGAGLVDAIGPAVSDVKIGERVAFAMSQGAYAEYAVVPAWKLVPLPPDLDLATAAAALLQGMTAHYLTHSAYPLKPGDTALVHAAAGGTGLLIVQMAKRRGARVLGTVSTDQKAALARAAGVDEIILYTQTDFEVAVKQLTNGEGIEVVYDSIGQSTFLKSLNCLKPRGYLVLFGQAGGPVPSFDPGLLAAKGSLFLTRPSLANYTSHRRELLQRAGDVIEWVQAGQLKLRIENSFPLAEAAEAHRQLAGRRTSGKLLLTP